MDALYISYFWTYTFSFAGSSRRRIEPWAINCWDLERVMEFVRQKYEEEERVICELLEHCSFIDNLYTNKPNEPNDWSIERGSI